MPVRRLNHAVLYVRDLTATVDFYRDALGLEVRMEVPGRAAFLRAPGSANDHDLGVFAVPDRALPAGRYLGLYHLAWEVDTLAELEKTAAALAAADALVGTSDHGTTKSLYGKDPNGLEFEIVWLIPADLLSDDAIDARRRIGHLDLEKEKARYGASTEGGIGLSRVSATT